MNITKIQKVLERHINRTLDSEFIKSLAMEIFVANDVVPDPAVLGSDKNFISDHDPGDEHVEQKFENERLRLAEELVPNQDSKFIYEQHKTADGDSVVTKRPFGGGVETRVQIDPKEEFKKLKWSKNNLVVTKNT